MKRKKSSQTKSSDCVIPSRPSTAALRKNLVDSSPYEEREVAEYVECELSKEEQDPVTVEHLELVKSEVVWGRLHKVWDVHTTDGRWWVVTEPMNLYSQTDFPSLDYILSFHVGLMARLAARESRRVTNKNAERFAAAWRRWEQAAIAVDEAREAEDFQAVGMKCRECLLTFVRDAQDDVHVPQGQEPPKRADFVHWSELLAGFATPGAHGKDLRAYLKQIASSAWPLVNWLTHTTSAVRYDAEIAVAATNHVLESFAGALIRQESKNAGRCPKCSSYQVQSFYMPELEYDPPYLLVCMACGYEAPAKEEA